MDEKAFEASLKLFVMRMVGLFSAISLMSLAVFFLPDIMRGNFFPAVREFFKSNPNITGFMIFMGPVMLIAAVVWGIDLRRWLRSKKTSKERP